MRIRELTPDAEPDFLTERLALDFVDAEYGYWITNEGDILNVDRREGHVQFLMDREEFFTVSPSQPYHEWYDAALDRGWVRIIAPLRDRRQMNFQFRSLTPAARKSLVGLIRGLLPYDRYVLEAKEYQVFDTPNEAIRFVQKCNETIGELSTATWTMVEKRG